MWTLNAPQHLQWSYENWRLLTPNKQTLRTKWSILFWCLLYFLTKTTLILPPLRSDSSPIALQGPYNAAIVSFLRCRWWGHSVPSPPLTVSGRSTDPVSVVKSFTHRQKINDHDFAELRTGEMKRILDIYSKEKVIKFSKTKPQDYM